MLGFFFLILVWKTKNKIIINYNNLLVMYVHLLCIEQVEK